MPRRPQATHSAGLWSFGQADPVRRPLRVLLTRGLPAATEFRKLLGGTEKIAPAERTAPVAGTIDPLAALIAPIAAPAVVVATPAAAMPVAPSSGLPSLPADADAASVDPLAILGGVTPSLPLAPPQGAFGPPVRWESAAISSVGRVRDENQDAFVERTGDGVWLVADGMGGHQGGKMASQLVTDLVWQAAATGDAAGTGRAIAEAVQSANALLRRRGEEQPGFDGGTTVVALCARGGQGIALWTGDSRLYRLRGDELTQLTRDHSVAEEEGAVAGDDTDHMLTRAVGGADVLALEELHFDIQPGDRLLLCSDGLYGELSPEDIAARLKAPQCAAAARALIGLALERGGADNATAVVVAPLQET